MQPHPDFEGNVLCFGILSLFRSISIAAQSGVSSDYDDDDDDGDGDDYRRTVVVHQRL